MFNLAAFNKLTQELSSKKASIVIIVLAIAARMALQLYFFDYSGDRSFQLLATKSFVEGHGFSILQVLPNNLSRQEYSPVIGWPPGYSIFLLPLYFVCGKSAFTAAILFEIISAALFVLITRKLLHVLDVSLWLINIYTLITGFFIYDFAAASSSDFCTLILFLFGIYCILLFIKKDKPPAFGILIGVLLFSCALTRYMYAPIVFPAALYLCYTGYLQNDRRIIRAGYYCVIVFVLLLICLYLYQYQLTGSAVYIIPTKKGFYPINLLRINAVLFAPFTDIPVLCTSLASFFNWSYPKLIETVWFIHLFPFGFALFFCIAFLLRKIKTRKNLLEHYVYLGLLSSLGIVFLLVFLSLRNAPVDYPLWTFVEEPRYYAFIVVFIHQLLFIFLFNSRARTTGRKIFVFITTILLAFQLLHGFYFVSKKLISENRDFTNHKETKEMNHFFYSALDSLQHSFPDKQVIATSNDPTFQNLAVLKGYTALYETSSINNPAGMNPARNRVFLVVLQYEVLPQYKKFLHLPAAKHLRTIGRYYFYVLET